VTIGTIISKAAIVTIVGYSVIVGDGEGVFDVGFVVGFGVGVCVFI